VLTVTVAVWPRMILEMTRLTVGNRRWQPVAAAVRMGAIDPHSSHWAVPLADMTEHLGAEAVLVVIVDHFPRRRIKTLPMWNVGIEGMCEIDPFLSVKHRRDVSEPLGRRHHRHQHQRGGQDQSRYLAHSLYRRGIVSVLRCVGEDRLSPPNGIVSDMAALAPSRRPRCSKAFVEVHGCGRSGRLVPVCAEFQGVGRANRFEFG